MNLDNFELEFEQAQTLEDKRKLMEKLLESDIDFSNKENREKLTEYRAQLNDMKESIEIEKDNLLNIQLEFFPDKWKLHTCIKDVYQENLICNEGSNYYLKVDDIANDYKLIEDDIPDFIKEYTSNIKPTVWVMNDNGIGSLKFEEILQGDLNEYFKPY